MTNCSYSRWVTEGLPRFRTGESDLTEALRKGQRSALDPNRRSIAWPSPPGLPIGASTSHAILSATSGAGCSKRRTLMKGAEISTMIRTLRLSLGLTQEQFAAKVGVTFSTVNRWENGRGHPSPLASRRIDELRRQNEHR